MFVGERCKPFRQFPDVSLGIVRIGVVVSGHNFVSNCNRVPVVHIVREVVEVEEPVHEVATHPELMEGRQWVTCTSQFWERNGVSLSNIGRRQVNKQTSSFETVQGVQRFLAARDVAPVDHPSLALPYGARQFLVHTEAERAVRNQVWHHKCPRTGRGVDRGRVNLWGGGGDERHVSRVGGCRRV